MKKVDLSRVKTFVGTSEVIFYYNPPKEFSKEYPYTGATCRFRIYLNLENNKWYSSGVVDTPLLEESFEEILLRKGRQNKEKFQLLVERAFEYVSNLKENK